MIPDGDSRAYSYSSVEPHSSRPMPELRFSITQQQNSFLRLLSTKLGMLRALCYNNLPDINYLLYIWRNVQLLLESLDSLGDQPEAMQPMGGASLMPTWLPLATEMLYMEATQQKHSFHTQYATLGECKSFVGWAQQVSISTIRGISMHRSCWF